MPCVRSLIPRNPAPKRRPRVERTEQAWLRASEMADLLAFVRFREPDLYPAFRLAALAGLRRGELAGLRWCDLDDDQSTLTIRRSRTIAGGIVVEGATKTSGSSSVIKIDPETVSKALPVACRLVRARKRLPTGSSYATGRSLVRRSPLQECAVPTRSLGARRVGAFGERQDHMSGVGRSPYDVVVEEEFAHLRAP